MSFWCLQFPPKMKWKQVNLRYHSSKVKFILLFFWRNSWLDNSLLSFTDLYKIWDYQNVGSNTALCVIFCNKSWSKIIVTNGYDIVLIFISCRHWKPIQRYCNAPISWLTRICFTQISLTWLFKSFPFLNEHLLWERTSYTNMIQNKYELIPFNLLEMIFG